MCDRAQRYIREVPSWARDRLARETYWQRQPTPGLQPSRAGKADPARSRISQQQDPAFRRAVGAVAPAPTSAAADELIDFVDEETGDAADFFKVVEQPPGCITGVAGTGALARATRSHCPPGVTYDIPPGMKCRQVGPSPNFDVPDGWTTTLCEPEDQEGENHTRQTREIHFLKDTGEIADFYKPVEHPGCITGVAGTGALARAIRSHCPPGVTYHAPPGMTCRQVGPSRNYAVPEGWTTTLCEPEGGAVTPQPMSDAAPAAYRVGIPSRRGPQAERFRRQQEAAWEAAVARERLDAQAQEVEAKVARMVALEGTRRRTNYQPQNPTSPNRTVPPGYHPGHSYPVERTPMYEVPQPTSPGYGY